MKPLWMLSLVIISCICAWSAPVPSGDDYGFLYWVHGWRDRSPEHERLLCVQTSRFRAEFDVEKAALSRLGSVKDPLPYAEAVSAPAPDIEAVLKPVLRLEVFSGGVSYTCRGADTSALKGLESPSRIIETGRFLQRFDITSLVFENNTGTRFPGTGRLEVVAWPDRLSLLLDVSTNGTEADAAARITLRSGEDTLAGETPLEDKDGAASGVASITWRPAGMNVSVPSACEVQATVSGPDAPAIPVSYDEKRNWFLVDLPEKQFDMAAEPEHQDEHGLRITNPSTNPECAPLLFAYEGPFTGVIGMTPLLFDKDGRQTALPVQISKNWHRVPETPQLYEGPWFHGCAWIPLQAGETWEGSLRFVYAHWGGVPAVSHAQLCLVGWGVNQQWDQVAIGSWGESICYDPDINLNRSMIDDVRPLMVHGMGSTPEKPVLWTWTNNVGGGDFLTWFNPDGNRQFPQRMRTAYLRYGPNLTEAVYAGTSGDGAVSMRITACSPRCDDVNRAFHRLRYDVLKPMPFSRLAFYQLGADNYNDHQFKTLARGNGEGLIEEWTFEPGGKKYDRAGVPCEGEAPWWFSAHEAVPNATRGGAWANRGLIVRSWRARLGGQDVDHPYASFFGTNNGVPSMNVELTPPPDLAQLEPGDYVETEVELVILPMSAADYYGPNENLRKSLEQHGNSWEPVCRLASLNTLEVTVHTGTLRRSYPVVIQVDEKQEALFSIRGGAGYVPCTITGLKDPNQGTLARLQDDLKTLADACATENKFHQADYNTNRKCYEMTCNLLLDTPEDAVQERHFRYLTDHSTP